MTVNDFDHEHFILADSGANSKLVKLAKQMIKNHEAIRHF
jgi:hypothetical protein